MTEHTPPDGRPRSSFVAAAASLCRLGRLRDVPVVLMLAWAGWLAIPWPLSDVAQARGTSDHALSTGVARGAEARGPIGARDPIASERARIAAEVHDAAGHGLAVIAMQAGVALLMLDENPEQVRASLEAIRSTSTQALDQLRSALDHIAPRPPDHDLARLVGGVRAAGLPVVLVPEEPRVPAHLAGTVHRVVRESLTNVLRHAGPTEALVRLTGGPRGFVLEVADRGRGPSGPAEGRGLAGMRTRVVEAGGTFSAGPREGGGFSVVARFPRETA
ncbi:sensor histidine kinase [Sphaerisporangium album]|uniref:sensor histidine kinase n=1 Tax=Sphaerisporangium album TaxID=509200 RepID=UPI0015F0EA90|nr:histidine kinase [Sphaerisporangium album]